MRATLPLLALLALSPITALAQGAASYAGPAVAPGAAGDPRQFHIVTVHVDGLTGLTASAAHPAEAFPTEPMPAGGGLLLRQPDAQGNWSVRAFMFHPPQIVVQQGEPVTLTFVDVHGPRFRIAVDGVAEPIAIRRGEVRSVTVAADRPGRIAFRALDQAPSMVGEVLVLPAAR
jgi:hypothetical protein